MTPSEFIARPRAEWPALWRKHAGQLRKVLSPSQVNDIATELAARKVAGMSAAELLEANFPEVREVCGPYVQEGITIFGAAPKTGKTTFMRQASAAVAEGGVFLDITCERGDVLFLSLEEGPRLFRRKLKEMNISTGAAGAIDIHFAWPQGGAAWSKLDEYVVSRPQTRLVVVDSLTRVREATIAKNTTQFQADYEAVNGAAAVAKKHPGLAVVFIHHTRKVRGIDPLDDVSGTYGLTAAADAYLVLRKEGRGGTLHAGGRLWDREESDFALTREAHRWHLVGVSDGLTDRERQVLQTIKDSGGMGPTDLAGVLGIKRATAYQFLDQLLAKGKVQRKSGFYIAI